MKSLGEFESIFRRALREHYEFAEVRIKNFLVITDLSPENLPNFKSKVDAYLKVAVSGDDFHLKMIGRDDFSNWDELDRIVTDAQPDLIISYRLLRVSDQRINTSLGVYIDTLSQLTPYPILVLPNPKLNPQEAFKTDGTVLVATEHLYSDHSLVNYAVHFTPKNGHLLLSHIEDEDTFEYFMNAIEKIPEIDDEVSRVRIAEQLKADPMHYLESAVENLSTTRPNLTVETHVEFGHLITSYSELVQKNDVSLLVFHTKDDTQMAMHSLGYSLAIEFKAVPTLLI